MKNKTERKYQAGGRAFTVFESGYHCNCVPTGVKRAKCSYLPAMRLVEVKRNGTCVDCGYYAVWANSEADLAERDLK